MTVLAFLILQAAALVVAPFPESHPYSFLNPVIDPWWHQLDQDTQLQLYTLWETTEPSLLAFGDADSRGRVLNGYFVSAKTMSLLQRHLTVSGEVIKAFTEYLAAKTIDFKDFIVEKNQPKGDGRFKSNSQRKWEDFAALVQYANFLKLNTKKSAVDVLDQLVKAKISTVAGVTGSKLQGISQLASNVQHSVREGISTVRESFS